MVNPYVLIASHNRVSITTKNIECLLSCNVKVILVVSSQKEYNLFREKFRNISVVCHPNMPLGKKWQAGVKIASSLNADPLIINGSDDILSPNFFIKVSELLRDGYHFIGLKSWYVYDMKSVFHFEYQPRMPLGGGRVYTKQLLEKLCYNIFDVTRDRLLDDKGWNRVSKSNTKSIIINEPLILSVKGDWPVMNPVKKIIGHPNAKLIETANTELVLKKFNYVRD